MRERKDKPPQPALENSSQSNEFRELTPRQRQSIPIVLATRTVQEGCKLAGISEPTWYIWIKVPAFKAEVERQREVIISEGLSRLKSMFSRAVERLEVLLDSKTESIQLRTSSQVIDYFTKVRAEEDIQKRLLELERLVEISLRRN